MEDEGGRGRARRTLPKGENEDKKRREKKKKKQESVKTRMDDLLADGLKKAKPPKSVSHQVFVTPGKLYGGRGVTSFVRPHYLQSSPVTDCTCLPLGDRNTVAEGGTRRRGPAKLGEGERTRTNVAVTFRCSNRVLRIKKTGEHGSNPSKGEGTQNFLHGNETLPRSRNGAANLSSVLRRMRR